MDDPAGIASLMLRACAAFCKAAREGTTMAYEPKTPAAKDLHTIISELSGAQHDWETSAAKLGRAYGNAFDRHEAALSEVAERYRLGAESGYWVLALLC